MNTTQLETRTDEIVRMIAESYSTQFKGKVFLDEGFSMRPIALALWDETVENPAFIQGIRPASDEAIAYNVARALWAVLEGFEPLTRQGLVRFRLP